MAQLHDMYRPLPFPQTEVFRAFYECFVTSEAGRIVYETLLHDWLLRPKLDETSGWKAFAYINHMLQSYEKEVEHGRSGSDGRSDRVSSASGGPSSRGATRDDWDPT